jgi:hypothetical protein
VVGDAREPKLTGPAQDVQHPGLLVDRVHVGRDEDVRDVTSIRKYQGKKRFVNEDSESILGSGD